MATQKLRVNTAKQSLHYGPFALVTGASSGIGRAFAIELAQQGYSLVLTSRRKNELDDLAAELRNRNGIQAIAIQADMGIPADIASLIETCKSIDIGLLVAAAGFGSSGAFLNCPIAGEMNMVDVNCRAVLALAHSFGQRFVAQKRGGIVLLSSLVAFQGVALSANYAATKAYVQSLAEALHIELKASGVDVIACAPGPIASGFAARAGMVMGMSQTPVVVARATLKALGRKTTVRPGYLSKLLEASFTGLPRSARVSIMSKVMKGMAARRPHDAVIVNPADPS